MYFFQSTSIKLKAFIAAWVIIIIFSSCNHSKLPANNWTEEDKTKAIATVKFILDANPEFREKEDEILQNTIDECIIKYPNVNDFKRDSDYVKFAFSAALIKMKPN